MKSSNVKPQSENHFIKEWNGTEFNLSIPAKITHSNKPFIYFYWPNSDKYATIERARKGDIAASINICAWLTVKCSEIPHHCKAQNVSGQLDQQYR